MALPSLEVKVLFIALLVGLAHIIAGVSIFFAPAALLSTPLASLDHLASFLGVSTAYCAVALIVAGVMAAIASSTSLAFHRHFHVVLLLPQQCFLVLQLLSISTALATGRYPDGYIPVGGAWFILCDQVWAWILAVSHSIWLAAFLYKGQRRGNHLI